MPLNVTNHNYYSTSSLGRRHTSSRSRDYSSSSDRNSLYGLTSPCGYSAGYSAMGRDSTYMPTSLTSSSMYIPSRSSLSSQSSRPSYNRPSSLSSTYSTPLTGTLHMSSAMSKRDSIIRSLVRNSPDLNSHHFISSDSVSMMASSDSIGSLGTTRRPYSSSATCKPSIRSRTTDLNIPSLMARDTSDLCNYPSYATTSGYGTTHRYTYRPILIERPSFANYVPRPREERISASIRAIRRDRPLIKFREKDNANPGHVRQLLNAWSNGKLLEEEEEDDDFTEIGRVKRDSIRSNDSGIGSFRSSFFRNSRRKSGESVADLDQIIDECDTEDDNKCASIPREIHKTSVDEGVQLESVEIIHTPCSSYNGYEDRTADLFKDDISRTFRKAKELPVQDYTQLDITQNRRRVRINMDKPIVSFVVNDKQTHATDNFECSNNLENISNTTNDQNLTRKLNSEDKKHCPAYILESDSFVKKQSKLIVTNERDDVTMIVENVIGNNYDAQNSRLIPIEKTENKRQRTNANLKNENVSYDLTDLKTVLNLEKNLNHDQVFCGEQLRSTTSFDAPVSGIELIHPSNSNVDDVVISSNTTLPLESETVKSQSSDCPTVQCTSQEKLPEVKEITKKKIKKYEGEVKKPKVKKVKKGNENAVQTTVVHSVLLTSAAGGNKDESLEQNMEKCNKTTNEESVSIVQKSVLQSEILKNQVKNDPLHDSKTDTPKSCTDTLLLDPNKSQSSIIKLSDQVSNIQKTSDKNIAVAAPDASGHPVLINNSRCPEKQQKLCRTTIPYTNTDIKLNVIEGNMSIESRVQKSKHTSDKKTLDYVACSSSSNTRQNSKQYPKDGLSESEKEIPCPKSEINEAKPANRANTKCEAQNLRDESSKDDTPIEKSKSTGLPKKLKQNALNSNEINQLRKLPEISNDTDSITIQAEIKPLDNSTSSAKIPKTIESSDKDKGIINLNKHLNVQKVEKDISEGKASSITNKSLPKASIESIESTKNVSQSHAKSEKELKATSGTIEASSKESQIPEFKDCGQIDKLFAPVSKNLDVLKNKKEEGKNLTKIQKCPSADFKVVLKETENGLNKIQKSSTAKAGLCFDSNVVEKINNQTKEPDIAFLQNTPITDVQLNVIDQTRPIKKVKKSTTTDFSSSNSNHFALKNTEPGNYNKLQKSRTTDCNNIFKSQDLESGSKPPEVAKDKDNQLFTQKLKSNFICPSPIQRKSVEKIVKQPDIILVNKVKIKNHQSPELDIDNKVVKTILNTTAERSVNQSKEKLSKTEMRVSGEPAYSNKSSEILEPSEESVLPFSGKVEKATLGDNIHNNTPEQIDKHINNAKTVQEVEKPKITILDELEITHHKRAERLNETKSNLERTTVLPVIPDTPVESEAKKGLHHFACKHASLITQNEKFITVDIQKSKDSTVFDSCFKEDSKDSVGHLGLSALELEQNKPCEDTPSIESTREVIIPTVSQNEKPVETIENKAKVKKEKKAKVEGEKPKKKKKKKDALTGKSETSLPPISKDKETSVAQQENNVEPFVGSAGQNNTGITNISDKSSDLILATRNQNELSSLERENWSSEKCDIKASTLIETHDNSEAQNVEYISNKTPEVTTLTDSTVSENDPSRLVSDQRDDSLIPFPEDHSVLSSSLHNSAFRGKQYSIEDFHLLKVLGRGSYGKVMLAELKTRSEYFAIKCLKKDVVLEDNDVECTMIEKEVLAMGSCHPYLCTLHCTFQSKSHLFFVMEYLSGGDLMFHIQQSGRFDQDRARFYGAEIVCALKYLHKQGIIYRDAKLDNICIDADGHIRLVDFGFCKLRIYRKECLPRNLCGTPDYMAPEIIKGYHYNQSVDWWSFGVLLYEMLIGQSPFTGADEEELFWSVCNEDAYYPRFISKEAKQLLVLLLEKDPLKRLGMPGCNAGDICLQPFFQNVNWIKVDQKELEPPFKPKLKSEIDVSNFDSDFTMENAALTPIDQEILSSIDQNQFNGFTYTNPKIFE